MSLDDLDGFFTFVVGTENGFGVLRDPIACKPAVMAETDHYVAFGSEYRALVGLPGIEQRRVSGSPSPPPSISGNADRCRTVDLGTTPLRDAERGAARAAARTPTRRHWNIDQSRRAAMPSPSASMRRSPSRSTALSAITAPA